jgi:hypothetical protein
MTNFEDKLSEQFKTLRIDVINEPKYQHHLYADYVELVSLISNDFVSASDIVDRLSDNGMKFPLEKEKLDGAIGLIDTEIDDTKEAWINIIFEVLSERKELYSLSYPFEIVGSRIIKKKKLNSINEFYIFLLISSSLKFFSKLQNVLTAEFEIISEIVLKNYLPSKAIVKAFGNNTEFEGNAKTKIEQLATILNIETDKYELAQISTQNSKEEGLDIIGWIPFSDSNPNVILILVQCGCGKEWYSKKFETSRYENYFHFYKQTPIHSLFIPYALSNKDGRFYQSKDIVKPTLVFERYRIIEYLISVEFDNKFLSKKIVEKCLAYQEDIV